MKKVPPSQVTREQIEALLAGDGVGEDKPVSLVVRHERFRPLPQSPHSCRTRVCLSVWKTDLSLRRFQARSYHQAAFRSTASSQSVGLSRVFSRNV